MIFGLFLIDRTRDYVTFLDPSTIIILIYFFQLKREMTIFDLFLMDLAMI